MEFHAILLFIAALFLYQTALASSSIVPSTLSAPFLSHASNSSPSPSMTNSPPVGADVASLNSILTSSNRNFSWGWVLSPDLKFFLSIVYIPSGNSAIDGSNSSTTTIDAAGSTASQQVWMANRNHPVSKSATLQLGVDGNLWLQDTDGFVAWSTNTTSGMTLELRGSGNLVLVDVDGNTVWQSFDHPSDTLLPGQVIGTGTKVIASVSYSNVSEGKYSVVMEEGGLIMYVTSPSMGSLPYHVVGFDNNNTVASVKHPFCLGTTMNYSTGGGILTFDQKPTISQPQCNRSFIISVGSNDNSSDAFFRLDSDGNFRTYVYRLHYGWGIDQEIFSGSLVCALPGKCGDFGVCSVYGSCNCPQISSINSSAGLFRARNPSDPTSGCALSQPPICNGSNEFVELTGAKYFADDFAYQNTSSLTDCKLTCATSCTCAVAFFEQKSGACYHYDRVMSIQKVSDGSYYAFIKIGSDNSSSDYNNLMNRPPDNSVSRQMVLGVALTAALVTAFCLVSFTTVGIKIRKRLVEMHADDAFLESLPGLPTRFSFKELHKATDGFQRKLGSGGFGSVYQGNLADGSRIAVKRLESARQGQKEFHAEVATLGSINHLNLVRLRGFCTQRSQCLLVYDYMANGSLDRWLFSAGENESKFLDWPTRYSIARDTARGLAFLHEESRERIVHLDIKPQNILLDESFVAKISDFGLSKLIDRGESDVVTNMRGTPGYVAPEWLVGAAVTSKSDVYSYGMVLLELVSGRRNLDLSRNTFWYFPAWAVLKVEEGKAMEVMDSRLSKLTEDMQIEVERMIKVAMWCIQEDPTIRPCMSTVLRILDGHCDMEEPPSLLQFAMRTHSAANISSSANSDRQYVPEVASSQLTITTDGNMTNSVLSAPR